MWDVKWMMAASHAVAKSEGPMSKNVRCKMDDGMGISDISVICGEMYDVR